MHANVLNSVSVAKSCRFRRSFQTVRFSKSTDFNPFILSLKSILSIKSFCNECFQSWKGCLVEMIEDSRAVPYKLLLHFCINISTVSYSMHIVFMMFTDFIYPLGYK